MYSLTRGIAVGRRTPAKYHPPHLRLLPCVPCVLKRSAATTLETHGSCLCLDTPDASHVLLTQVVHVAQEFGLVPPRMLLEHRVVRDVCIAGVCTRVQRLRQHLPVRSE